MVWFSLCFTQLASNQVLWLSFFRKKTSSACVSLSLFLFLSLSLSLSLHTYSLTSAGKKESGINMPGVQLPDILKSQRHAHTHTHRERERERERARERETERERELW